MLTREDLQSYLDRLDAVGLELREVEPGLWILRTAEGAEIAINYAPPVVVLRVKVIQVPDDPAHQRALYRQLLEYNARELVHGSYGLEGNQVVLTDTLELENLDFTEFQASVESISLALASHLGALATYRGS